MNADETNKGPAAALALAALGWILGDDARAERLLALTGLTPDGLRARLGDNIALAAVLGFLEAYEPDLLACAEAIGMKPADLIDARRTLES